MPTSVVKTERDERLWTEAKATAKQKGRNEYDYIMGIFLRMKHREGGRKGKRPWRDKKDRRRPRYHK